MTIPIAKETHWGKRKLKRDSGLAKMPAALERRQRLSCLRRNLLFTLRLSCHETDANQFREEGRHFHLDRHDRLRLYDRSYDLRPLRFVD
jgi:hypothetical protein